MKLVTGTTFAMVLALAGIAFTSCKKDKSKPSDPTPITKKITRIEENGSTSSAFEYNTDGTLRKITATLAPGQTNVFNISYNTQKQVTEVTSNEGLKVKYVYENNRVRLTENFEDGEKVSENSFQYEGTKMTSNTLLMAFPQNNGNILYRPVYRTAYHYYPSGALQKVSIYEYNTVTKDLDLDHEYVYQQYDTRKNPMAVMADISPVLLYQPIHLNNVLIEKLYDITGEVMETTTNEYVYDTAGYPVTSKSTVQPRGGTQTVTNIKYFY